MADAEIPPEPPPSETAPTPGPGFVPGSGSTSPWGLPSGSAPPPGSGPPPAWAPPPAPPQQGGPIGPPAWAPPYQLAPVAGYPPGGYVPPHTEGRVYAALVCGILAFVVCPGILAVVAIALAYPAGDAISRAGGRLSGSGMVTAAKVLGWINLSLILLVLAAIVGSLASRA